MFSLVRKLMTHVPVPRSGLERSAKSGAAEQLLAEPPVFLLHNVVNAEEASMIRSLTARRRAQWSNHHPRVCFQHDAYTGHGGLTHAWEWLSGTPGAGARGCFTQKASHAVAGALPLSESLFVYRGQVPGAAHGAPLSCTCAHMAQGAHRKHLV